MITKNGHCRLSRKHFQPFALADDGEQRPVDDLKKALEEHGVSQDSFWLLKEGEGRTIK